MNCPACREAMIVLEHGQVEVDHCVACGGIWLDRGEIGLLLGEADGKQLISSFANPAPSSKKCPICSKKMEKVLCGPTEIDRCMHGDGLWFDLGELEQIVRSGKFGENSKVLDWLKNVFVRTN